MKRLCLSVGLVGLVTLLAIVLAATPLVFAKGEGSFVIKAENGNTYRFGGQMRMIPTSENNWDFGLGTVVVRSPVPSAAPPGFTLEEVTRRNFKEHVNEAGRVAQGYIRTEARLYFNAEDKDGKWDFYSALEFDSVVDQDNIDRRGRDYGLERLHGSVAIPGLEQVRFHAGWDIYFLDAVTAGAGFLYGDDDPGFWLTGDFDSIEFKLGYHKKLENNFASRDEADFIEKQAGIESDNDRDIYSAMLTYHINDDNEVRFMGLYDRMNTRSESEIDSPIAPFEPLTEQKGADVDTYRVGLLYSGKLGIFEPEFEIAYQGGEAKDITTEFDGTLDDQDIEAYALYGDVALNLTDLVGFKVIPHVGFMYTSGDDDPDDDNLEGYVGVANAQRFTPRFGGEDTIIGDTNVVLGTLLYGYLPEFYGNLGGTQQGGVATGGLANGSLGGRGDNPGLTMIGGGITIEPREFISYRTNFMWFEWNEDFSVVNINDPLGAAGGLLGPANIKIDSGTAGQQWSNSLRISLNRHVHIFGNATLFFPGDAVKDVTEALGNRSDKTAQRYAVALVWRF